MSSVINRLMGVFLLAFFSVIALSSCKEVSGYKPDQKQIQAASINKSIDSLIKQADQNNDDNEKARLLGEASMLLSEKGDLNRAVEVARRALRANPTNVHALATKGEYYLNRGRTRQAKNVLSTAIMNDPNSSRANYLLGNALYVSESYDQAESYFLQAISLDAGNMDAYNNLAATYMKNRKTSRALSLLQDAIDQDPELAMTYKNAGIAAEKLGKTARAREYYQKYIELNPYADDLEVVESWLENL